MKQIQGKDKQGNYWYGIVSNYATPKIGTTIDGGKSLSGKPIGEIKILKIEDPYYDVSGQ